MKLVFRLCAGLSAMCFSQMMQSHAHKHVWLSVAVWMAFMAIEELADMIRRD